MLEDYYKVLGINYDADQKAIQKAFHTLAKRYHPDKNPNDTQTAEKFKNISEAYVILSDPIKKSQYDLKLKYGHHASYIARSQRYRSAVRKTPRSTSFSYRKQVVFTRQARVLGGISIIAILLTVTVTTIFLTRYNAQFDFHRGLANYQNQRYSAAYFNLKESLSPLSPYLAATHLLMGEICFNQQRDVALTRNHIIQAYEANPSDSITARLLYLEGKVNYYQDDYVEAYKRFQDATDYLPEFDSAIFRMAEIDLLEFSRFEHALTHYQTVLERNPKNHQAVFGSAYCYQKLGQHQKAIEEINRYMSMRRQVGMAYYIKAISAQALDLKDISCQNFVEAYNLGVPQALDSLTSYCGMSLPN